MLIWFEYELNIQLFGCIVDVPLISDETNIRPHESLHHFMCVRVLHVSVSCSARPWIVADRNILTVESIRGRTCALRINRISLHFDAEDVSLSSLCGHCAAGALVASGICTGTRYGMEFMWLAITNADNYWELLVNHVTQKQQSLTHEIEWFGQLVAQGVHGIDACFSLFFFFFD